MLAHPRLFARRLCRRHPPHSRSSPGVTSSSRRYKRVSGERVPKKGQARILLCDISAHSNGMTYIREVLCVRLLRSRPQARSQCNQLPVETCLAEPSEGNVSLTRATAASAAGLTRDKSNWYDIQRGGIYVKNRNQDSQTRQARQIDDQHETSGIVPPSSPFPCKENPVSFPNTKPLYCNPLSPSSFL